jgi:hypothetical protein
LQTHLRQLRYTILEGVGANENAPHDYSFRGRLPFLWGGQHFYHRPGFGKFKLWPVGKAHWSDIRASLVGNWGITHHSGYALAGTMVIPLPADGQTDIVTIALHGDVLEVRHPEMQAPMVLQLANEPAWALNNDNPAVPKPTLTLSDAELMIGCDQMQLPRIIGTTSAVVDGTRMDFVNRLIFLSEDLFYGVMEMTTVAHGTTGKSRAHHIYVAAG